MKIFTIFIFVILCSSYFAKMIPFDLVIGNQSIPTSHYQCVKQQYNSMVTWVEPSELGISQVVRQSFFNAKNAGLQMQIGFSPCRALSPQAQVKELINKLGQNTIERVWVYPIIITSSTCHWKKDYEQNCQFISQLLLALRNEGLKVGMAALSNYWVVIFGSRTACPQLSSQLLAWVPSKSQQDGRTSFDNYKTIGGWLRPYMKYFDGYTICGRGYSMNYFE